MIQRFALTLGVCVSCSGSPFFGRQFAPVEELSSLRVLAIRAEPSALAPSGSVHLDALVYVPPGSDSVSYAWSWCASLGSASDDFACQISEDDLTSALDPDASQGVSIAYSLGSESTAVFSYPAPSSLLKSLCPQASTGATGETGATGSSGTSGSVSLNCAAQSVTVAVVLTVTAGDTQVRAYRPFTINLTAETANLNPTIDDVSMVSSDGASGAVELQPGSDYTLLASLPSGASESVSLGSPGGGPSGGSGQSETQLEGLSLNWYVSAGTLGTSSSRLDQGTAPDTRDWASVLASTWTTPKQSTRPIDLYLVVRDTRGGVGWATKQVSIGTGAR